MFNNKFKILFPCLLSLGISSVCLTNVAHAVNLKRQTIQNLTGVSVNDLQILFTEDTTDVILRPRQQPPGNNANGVQQANARQYEWAQQTFGTIPNNGKADLDYRSNCKRCQFKIGQWTLDGVAQERPVDKIGSPGILETNSPLSLTFFNEETFSITYNDIQLFKDNDISNFNLDDFLNPTGTLVSGLPSSITLDPGESFTLTFNDFVEAPSTYVLSTASVFATSEPTNVFTVATAYDFGEDICIPEPSSLLGLLALGALGTASISKHQLQSSKSSQKETTKVG